MQTKVAEGALIQLRAWLAQRDLPEDGRLPPERELIEILGVRGVNCVKHLRH